MPISTTSLVPFNATNFLSGNGTTYKGSIDAATAIASNPAGSMYVYPNSPAAMNVLVDDAFNLPQLSQAAPYVFNGGSGPNTVSIPAPGSNSYYACVYFDLLTFTNGVVFSSIAASPVPRIPTALWQVPLAFVLVATGQTSITAANILDARSWVQPQALTFSLGTVAVNTSLNCQNASSVSVRVGFSSVGGFQLTLNNVRNGCNLALFIQNVSGGNANSFVLSTMPDGTAYTVNAISASATVIWNTTSIAQTNTQYIAGAGAAIGPNIFLSIT